jgi:hypothetical protein
MAYIGQDPVIGRYIIVDQISGGFNGTASGFTLAAGGQGVIPGLAQNVLLSLGGVIQQPGTDYTVSGSGITFTTPPLSGTTFFATVLGDVQAVGTPSDGTVLPASIASSGTFVFPNITTTGTTLIASGNASTPSLAVIGDTNTGLYSPGADQLSITTGGTERFLIDSSGRLGIGTSSLRQVAGATANVQAERTGAGGGAALSLLTNNSSGVSASLSLGASRGAAGTPTSVLSTDIVGLVNFFGADGTDYDKTVASIRARAIGTIATDRVPGQLEFYTAENNTGSTLTQRLTIDNTGRVGIGTTSPNSLLHLASGDIRITGTGATQRHLRISNSGGATEYSIQADGSSYLYNDHYLAISSGGGAERLRINSAGLVGIGTSSPDGRITVQRPTNNQGISGGLSFKGQDGTTQGGIGTDGVSTNNLQILAAQGIYFHTGNTDGTTNPSSS